MRIKVASVNSPPLGGEYNRNSTPSSYTSGICTLHRSREWQMANKLGLEIEYTIQVLTHEQLHATIAKVKHRTVMNDRLLHLSDICALLGF